MLTVLPHRSFTIRHFGSITLTASGASKPTYTTISAIGTMSACSPSDIARLEEGKRTRQSFKFITNTSLTSAGQTGQLPDWIQYGSDWYEITNSNPWENGVMSHYEYIITKIENPKDYLQ